MKTPARLLLPALALLATACASDGPRDPSSVPLPRVFGAESTTVPEAFVSAATPEHEIDSLAATRRPDGSTWLVATAKETHSLVVYDGDTGAPLRTVGGRGEGPGQFNRPNGIAIEGDLVFVVERDNHRVQVLRLPDFEPVGLVGADVLRSPYGLWLHALPDGRLEMLVTDSFMADYKTMLLPPMAELDQRVKRFVLTFPVGGGVQAEYAGHFGDTTEEGALRMVESIVGDPLHDRLMIAEEDTRVGTTLRVYDLAGRYSGNNLPRERFKAQAEGVALWACPDGSGYWLATDQNSDLTVFHVFDRRELGYLGSFNGGKTAMTDGIWLHQDATAAFPDGVLYAAHNDEGVAAFDWRVIAEALDIRPRCP